MPPQIICASALPGKTGKHENHIFHSIGLCYTHNAPVRCLPERKIVIFYTATDTVTDLANAEHDGNRQQMLCSLPKSYLVHSVDRFDSEEWFTSDQVIF